MAKNTILHIDLWRMSNEELVRFAKGEVRAPLTTRSLATHILARRGHRVFTTRKGYGLKISLLLVGGSVALFGALVMFTWLWWLWAALAIIGVVSVFVVEIRAHIGGVDGGIIPPWHGEFYEELPEVYRSLVAEREEDLAEGEVWGLYCGSTTANDAVKDHEKREFRYFYYELDGVRIVGRDTQYAQYLRNKSTMTPLGTVLKLETAVATPGEFKILTTP